MSSILPSSLSSGTSGTSSTGTSSGTALTSTGAAGTVSSSGLGSGLDINSIVQQLVAAEGNGPAALITKQQTNIQTKISAEGQLQSAASALQASLATLATAAQFQTNAANVADKTVATATADSTAAPGSYSLSVVQLAYGAQLISGPVTNSTTAVGTGTLTVKVGSNTFSVAIDSTNNTLAGIASAIGKAGAAYGISASVLNATDGSRLLLSSAATGASNAVTVTQSGGDGGLASLVYDPANSNTKLTQLQAAQDAQIKLAGYTYNSPSNTVTGALTGVTINLVGASATGATTNLTVATDQTSAQNAVQTFVKAYNSYAGIVSSLSSYDASTGTAGALLGDSTLNGLVNSINSAINASVGSLKNGPFSTLAEIGIVANTDGTLGVDNNKLNTAFSQNYAAVAQLFSANDGLATKLNNVINNYTAPVTGVFATQTKNLQQNLTDLAAQRTALNQRLATLQNTLLAQYNAMDALVAQLKNTGTSLMAQLNSISYPGKSTSSSG
ncbi:MAG: flagellar filament capping protein FliD [Proteobacteria bacterium]|nr:flagellar filament capping protein FliD [Pseudomonadota bacterium]